MKPSTIVSALFLVFASAALWFERSSQRETIARLQADVRHLELRPSETVVVAATERDRGGDASVAAEAPANVAVVPANTNALPITEPTEESTSDVRLRLESSFGSAPSDAWSASASASVARSFPAALPAGSRIDTVACRSTSCRVESSHPNPDAYRTYLRNLMLMGEARPWNGAFFADVVQGSEEVDAPLRAVVFYQREGVPLHDDDVE